MSTAFFSRAARWSGTSLVLLTFVSGLRAAELPSSAELKYIGPYRIPAVMTLTRNGGTYMIVTRIHASFYPVVFQTSGSVLSHALKPSLYTDTRKGKMYAQAQFANNSVTHRRPNEPEKIAPVHGPALDLFSLVWQLVMTNGQFPAGLHITTGKKLYPVSGAQKIGESQYRIGSKDVTASRFQFKRGDHTIEYAFATGFNNIPVHITYKVKDKVYVFRLVEASLNGALVSFK